MRMGVGGAVSVCPAARLVGRWNGPRDIFLASRKGGGGRRARFVMALSANLLPRRRAFPPSLSIAKPRAVRAPPILSDCKIATTAAALPSLPRSLAGPLFVFGQRWRGIDCHTIDSVRHDDAGAKPDPPREEGAAVPVACLGRRGFWHSAPEPHSNEANGRSRNVRIFDPHRA